MDQRRPRWRFGFVGTLHFASFVFATSTGSSMLRRLAILLAMILMAVVATWPLATRLNRSIPQGAETSPTVPVFNLWTVGWNLDRVWSRWQHFWDAPHFAPAEKTLALSEPLIASQALAGFAWLPPPVAYNLFLLSAIALNGGVTWLALRRRRVPWPVALLISGMMIRLPFVQYQLGLLQCVLVAGLIGVIHFGEEAFATGRLSRLWLAAGCFDLTFLACGYYGVFLSLVLPACGGVWIWQYAKRIASRSARRAREGAEHLGTNIGRWPLHSCGSAPTGQPHDSPGQCPGSGLSKEFEALKGRPIQFDQGGCAPSGLARLWRSQTQGGAPVGRWPWADLWLPRWGGTAKMVAGVMLGVLLILAVIAPIALLQSRVLSDPHYERARELIQELSARPSDYLAAPFSEWFEFVGVARWHEAGRWKLSPGLLKVALALVGVVVGVRSCTRRSWTLTWLAVLVAAWFGSLGLNFQIAGWCPYGTLLDWFPALARLRTPARMSVLVQIAVVFLAAEALLWGYRRIRIVVPRLGVRATRLAWGLFWLVGVAACCEVPLRRLAFVEIPPVATQKRWIDWLKNNTAQETVIAHVPFPDGPLPRNYESETWAMYWGLFHHRRMVNGFSGFFPASYLELKTQMRSFPDEASVAALRARGVNYCVVKQSFLDVHPHLNVPESAALWELVFQDPDAGVVLFRLGR